MARSILTLATALAMAALPMAGIASAQTSTAPTAAVPFITKQPANEWLARVFIGASVQNTAGEAVGDINDLVFNPQGHISTVVLGIGGFLGMGERNVAIPYSALSFKAGGKGERLIVVALSKDALMKAPVFTATEMTLLDKVENKATEIGRTTVEKAVELKDKAAEKIEDMKKSEPVKQ